MAQFPSQPIAELSYDFRTLGLGYANLGGLLMARASPTTAIEGRALAGAITALMTGAAYAISAEMAGELGPFPGYAANREAMLRVIRNHRRAAYGETRRLRGPARSARWRSMPPTCPSRRWSTAARKAWDDALELGETARLPQRPGHGDRADRHDRPGDGLRHHGHRARLRPGQVQEAGRRRLLQDHQPHGAAGARQARLRRRADRRHRALCRRPRHAQGRARDQSRVARRQGLHAGGPGAARARRCRAPSTSSSCSTSYTLGEAFCRDVLGFSDQQLADSSLRPAGSDRFLARADPRRPTSIAAAR